MQLYSYWICQNGIPDFRILVLLSLYMFHGLSVLLQHVDVSCGTLFSGAGTPASSSHPQQHQSSEEQKVPQEGLWIEPVKTQRLTVAPDRRVSSRAEACARRGNQIGPEAILLYHVYDPFANPWARKVIVRAVGQIQNRGNRPTKVQQGITYLHSASTGLNKVKVEQRQCENPTGPNYNH